MKETKHTPEPWHQGIYDNPKRLALAIFDEGHDEVAVADTVETARRIVACVNALEGIPTEILEMAGTGLMSEAAVEVGKLTKERDELLAALKWVSETQKRNYGNATNLHIDMLDWPNKYHYLIEKYRA